MRAITSRFIKKKQSLVCVAAVCERQPSRKGESRFYRPFASRKGNECHRRQQRGDVSLRAWYLLETPVNSWAEALCCSLVTFRSRCKEGWREPPPKKGSLTSDTEGIANQRHPLRFGWVLGSKHHFWTTMRDEGTTADGFITHCCILTQANLAWYVSCRSLFVASDGTTEVPAVPPLTLVHITARLGPVGVCFRIVFQRDVLMSGKKLFRGH